MLFTGPDLVYDRAKEKEWIVTNGIGGYSSSTIIGANTRKYHGLLVASLMPPVRRMLILSKVEEVVRIGDKTYALSTNRYPGVIHPEGYRFQERFVWDMFPVFIYKIGDMIFKKTVFMVHGSNTTVIQYEIENGRGATVSIRPFINARDFHHNLNSNLIDWRFEESAGEKKTLLKATYFNSPVLILASDLAGYRGDGFWVHDMVYEKEQERGLEDRDDHYSPGEFLLDIDKARLDRGRFNIIAIGGDEKTARSDFEQFYPRIDTLFEREAARKTGLIGKMKINAASPVPGRITDLVLAADSFIVSRWSTGSKSIIAGYPWFSDWGRDAMISLPGLTLVTGRYDDARLILKTFAKSCMNGLVPNRFSDYGGRSDYNTVDASLWFVNAVYKFLEYTDDHAFVKRYLLNVMEEIVEYYRNGTGYNIFMDDDCLIHAGTRDIQLTWMDAKVGDDLVVTPRNGKAVEINALWYNALKIMEQVTEGDYDTETTRKSFNEKFWNKKERCLYDVIEETDASIRPNQIFAVSLPFPVLDKRKQRAVVTKVQDELLTPFGLRSLSPSDPRYRGRYEGGVYSRDTAYHQGTVWAWLIGPFISAYVRIHRSRNGRRNARKFLDPLIESVGDAGLGTISEIFDGDPPHRPRGCISQAWSVAEVLRCYFEDVGCEGCVGV